MPIDRIHHDSLTAASERQSPQRSFGAATGGLLVAIDDQSESRGVLSVTELLARRERANAHLVGVAAVSELPDTLTMDEREALREHQRVRLRNRTKRRLQNTIGRGVYWSTDAALGALPEILADPSRSSTTAADRARAESGRGIEAAQRCRSHHESRKRGRRARACPRASPPGAAV